eukprot:Clim_evm43s215 gene=Clim_evmTU43s215
MSEQDAHSLTPSISEDWASAGEETDNDEQDNLSAHNEGSGTAENSDAGSDNEEEDDEEDDGEEGSGSEQDFYDDESEESSDYSDEEDSDGSYSSSSYTDESSASRRIDNAISGNSFGRNIVRTVGLRPSDLNISEPGALKVKRHGLGSLVSADQHSYFMVVNEVQVSGQTTEVAQPNWNAISAKRRIALLKFIIGLNEAHLRQSAKKISALKPDQKLWQGPYGFLVLMVAIKAAIPGLLPEISMITRDIKMNFRSKNVLDNDRSLLHYAVLTGNREIVSELVRMIKTQNLSDVEGLPLPILPDASGLSPMEIACYGHQWHMVKELCQMLIDEERKCPETTERKVIVFDNMIQSSMFRKVALQTTEERNVDDAMLRLLISHAPHFETSDLQKAILSQRRVCIQHIAARLWLKNEDINRKLASHTVMSVFCAQRRRPDSSSPSDWDKSPLAKLSMVRSLADAENVSPVHAMLQRAVTIIDACRKDEHSYQRLIDVDCNFSKLPALKITGLFGSERWVTDLNIFLRCAELSKQAEDDPIQNCKSCIDTVQQTAAEIQTLVGQVTEHIEKDMQHDLRRTPKDRKEEDMVKDLLFGLQGLHLSVQQMQSSMGVSNRHLREAEEKFEKLRREVESLMESMVQDFKNLDLRTEGKDCYTKKLIRNFELHVQTLTGDSADVFTKHLLLTLAQHSLDARDAEEMKRHLNRMLHVPPEFWEMITLTTKYESQAYLFLKSMVQRIDQRQKSLQRMQKKAKTSKEDIHDRRNHSEAALRRLQKQMVHNRKVNKGAIKEAAEWSPLSTYYIVRAMRQWHTDDFDDAVVPIKDASAWWHSHLSLDILLSELHLPAMALSDYEEIDVTGNLEGKDSESGLAVYRHASGRECILQFQHIEDTESRRRIETELAILTSLHRRAHRKGKPSDALHKAFNGIMPLLGFFPASPYSWCLEFPIYRAGTLHDYLNKLQEGQKTGMNDVQVMSVRNILRQVLDAIQYLHENGIVHGFIDAKNIQMQQTQPPQVVMANFGAGSIGSFRGNPYPEQTARAPERIGHDNHKLLNDISSATDMFDFGLLALRAICGMTQDLYVIPETQEVHYEAVVKAATDTSELRPWQAFFGALLQDLLQYQPDHRISASLALRHIFFAYDNNLLFQLDSVRMNSRESKLVEIGRALKVRIRRNRYESNNYIRIDTDILLQSVTQQIGGLVKSKAGRCLSVKYKKQLGIDQGGLTRDLFSRVFTECHKRHAMPLDKIKEVYEKSQKRLSIGSLGQRTSVQAPADEVFDATDPTLLGIASMETWSRSTGRVRVRGKNRQQPLRDQESIVLFELGDGGKLLPIPKSLLTIPLDEALSYYQCIGRCLALVILERVCIPNIFPSSLWKYLMTGSVEAYSFVDLADFCPATARGSLSLIADLSSMRKSADAYLDFEGLIPASVEEYEELALSVPKILPQADTPVDSTNMHEFVSRKIQFILARERLYALDAMASAFREWIEAQSSFPDLLLSLSSLHAAELQELCCGVAKVTPKECLKAITHKGGGIHLPEGEQQIRLFEQVVHEWGENKEELLNGFIQFATGMWTLPSAGHAFKITVYHKTSMSNNSLPEAHTCGTSVELPYYPDYETMEAKMRMAIEETAGRFDIY